MKSIGLRRQKGKEGQTTIAPLCGARLATVRCSPQQGNVHVDMALKNLSCAGSTPQLQQTTGVRSKRLHPRLLRRADQLVTFGALTLRRDCGVVGGLHRAPARLKTFQEERRCAEQTGRGACPSGDAKLARHDLLERDPDLNARQIVLDDRALQSTLSSKGGKTFTLHTSLGEVFMWDHTSNSPTTVRAHRSEAEIDCQQDQKKKTHTKSAACPSCTEFTLRFHPGSGR